MDALAALIEASLFTRAEVLASPCPVPPEPGVYAWWFDAPLPGVPTAGCVERDRHTLLYVGISPKGPPKGPASSPPRQNLRSRLKDHFRGTAEGSTLRLTLGVLLADQLGIQLRRVGSGTRRTFADGEAALSEWMEAHARVSWIAVAEPWVVEHHLISTVDLPLNLADNDHPYRPVLSELRSEAKRTAAELPVV